MVFCFFLVHVCDNLKYYRCKSYGHGGLFHLGQQICQPYFLKNVMTISIIFSNCRRTALFNFAKIREVANLHYFFFNNEWNVRPKNNTHWINQLKPDEVRWFRMIRMIQSLKWNISLITLAHTKYVKHWRLIYLSLYYNRFIKQNWS